MSDSRDSTIKLPRRYPRHYGVVRYRIIGSRWTARVIDRGAPEQAPPLHVYVPYVPEPTYQKFMPLKDEVLPTEEQPLPAALSPTANSPTYVPESDPEADDDEDPKEDPADYPVDGRDRGGLMRMSLDDDED
ncbi:hypothetical protein Tco_0810041 [Tanacetum coccineum]